MKGFLLALILSVCFASPVSARWVTIPEGPTGAAICSDNIDQDADGTADNCSGAADMSTADGSNRGIPMSSAVIVAPYAALTDASAPTGAARELPLNSHPFDGEVMVSASFANATTYGWVTINNPTSVPRLLWIHTASMGRYPDNAVHATVIPVTNGYQVVRIGTTGSLANSQLPNRINGTTQRTWALNGSHTFHLKWEPGLKPACLFFSPTSTFSPPTDSCSPGGAPSVTPDVIIKRVTTAPVDGDDALWDLANAFTWEGFDNSAGLTTSVCKALWQDTTTDRLFLMCNVPDTEVILSGLSNDSNGIITGNHDGIDFRWKSDLIRAFDANAKIVAADISNPPVYADGDYSGSGGARTLTPNFNTTTSRTVVASTSYKIFLALDLGFNATQGQLGLCQIAIKDKDTDLSTTLKFFRGTTSAGATDIQQFGVCEFSSTIAEVPADTTPPTVTPGTPPEENILANSADIKFSSNESGTAVVKWDTATKANCASYANTSASKQVTASATEFISVSGLPDGTAIFYRTCVTDAAGNQGGYASEESFTTASLVTGTHFVGNTAQGSGNCSSAANRCIPTNVWTTALGAWANVGPGSVIIVADGNYAGSTLVLSPPAGLSGVSGNPITVKAQNDGGALFDGQDVRRPVRLASNNSWWILEGFNVCCAAAVAPSAFHVVLGVGTDSNNNIIRRIVCWDANPGTDQDGECFGNHHNTGNLFEDVAAFGNARKLFASSQGGNNATLRRGFFCWGGSQRTGPKMDVTLVYDHFNQTAENVIAMFCERVATEGMAANISYDGLTSVVGTERRAFSRLYGSMSVLVPGREFPASFGIFAGSVDEIHMKDVISFFPPGEHTTKRVSMFTECVTENLGSILCTNPNLSITNYTSIGGNGIFAHSHWQQSNVKTGATLTDVYGAESLWVNDGTKGATICTRYVNGVLTTTPLFPWPMRDRINAAVTASGRSVSYLWGSDSLNIDTFLEARFGTIPAACKS